jgi:hypothetical protein
LRNLDIHLGESHILVPSTSSCVLAEQAAPQAAAYHVTQDVKETINRNHGIHFRLSAKGCCIKQQPSKSGSWLTPDDWLSCLVSEWALYSSPTDF